MSFNRISAAEAASLIKHGYNIGLSGFTPPELQRLLQLNLQKLQKRNMPKVIHFK